MKTLTLIILLSFLSLEVNAGFDKPNLVVSYIHPDYRSGTAPAPIENRESTLWYAISSCWLVPPFITHVEYSDSEILVVAKYDLSKNAPTDKCTPAPPPSYYPVMQLNPMEVGTYTLHYYLVPDSVVFPPDPADYLNYYIDSVEFEVLGAPPTIDATSNFSITLLILFIFSIGFYQSRLKKF